jgi:hypothetical protein
VAGTCEWGNEPSGSIKSIYRVLVGKPEGERPLGRSRRGWEDNLVAHIEGGT